MRIAKLIFCLALLCPVLIHAQNLNAEEKAVMKVIKEETRANFERDKETWENSFVQTDYYREHTYWEGWKKNPVRTTQGWKVKYETNKGKFEKGKPKTAWNEAKYVRSNINIRISSAKDMAWVTYDQKAVNPETKEVLGRSHETRILEKHDGQWKIAYLGYHYLPKEAETTMK